MASPAQALANAANAQYSTGPRTAEGKARSSRNGLKHGLATGVLVIAPEEQEAFNQLAYDVSISVVPIGALEEEAATHVAEASWRLRKVHILHQEMAASYELDPLVNPDCDRAAKQLARYRATLEAAFYRALKLLGELQTRRAARTRLLHPVEQNDLPPEIDPSVYRRELWSPQDREEYLRMIGRIGPDQIWDQHLDENHQAAWVRRPPPPEVESEIADSEIENYQSEPISPDTCGAETRIANSNPFAAAG